MANTVLRPLKSTYETFQQHPRHVKHPLDSAWCVQRALLSWVQPLMELGQKKQLDAEDLWPLQQKHQAEHVSRKFTHDFQRTHSMYRAFMGSFSVRFFITGLAFLVSMLCNLLGPIVLRHVVSSLTNMSSFSVNDAALWVTLLFASQVLQALVDAYGSLESETIAIEFIASVKTLIFHKTLRLSAESRKEMSTGAIANMYTSDSDAIMGTAYLVHQAWLIPLQIAVVSYMLYNVLHLAAFAGIGVLILMLVINQMLSRRMFKYQRIYRKSKDIRMKKVTEVFKAIGIVKFNAWEDRFLQQIGEARATEMKDLFKRRILVACNVVLLWGMPVFISIASFGTYTGVLKRELTPAIVFTSIALFQLVQGPLRQITSIIPLLVQSKVAIERVSEFLEMPEIDSHSVLTIEHPSAEKYIAQNVIISIENGEFGWGNEESLLRDINLQIKAGDFYVVHGSVGCGKSSLCSAILGEMIKRNGTVYVGSTIAYCSQQPWIRNMTVRENILFGLPFDRKKYEKVLDACALTTDIKALPAGDNTEIGERGINLSGGQKARIALARACYSDSGIYILDSPLSAVDAIVQNEIFQKCFLGLLRHKTIILVTHNPEIIESKHITHAVTINSIGSLIETHHIQSRSVHEPIISPLAAHKYAKVPFSNNRDEFDETKVVDNVPVRSTQEESELNEEMALISPAHGNKIMTYPVTADTIENDANLGKLIEDEERFEGRVSGHVFSAYYHAVGGLPVLALFLLSQATWQGLQISSDFWLGAWSSDNINKDPSTTPSTFYRLSIYSIFGISAAAMVMVRMLMVTFCGLGAAAKMFNAMTNSLMHAPMRFFDTNPIGRILTRYGGDVSVVDANIPPLCGRTASTVFSVGCSAVTAAIVIQWKGLLLIPIVYLYFRIGSFYVQPMRELQRLSKTTQAPVLNHLSETVDGGAVIRAFGSAYVQRFLVTNYGKLDENSKVWFANLCVSQWFSLRIQLVGTLLVLVVTSSLMLLHDELGPAVIGLAFSYALKASQNLERLVQTLSQIEQLMISPERIQEYTDIPQEAPQRIAAMDPPLALRWPSIGSIQFENVSFRYKTRDRLVLQNVNFTIKGGEKIGIVGRTGAGKSSLTMALFRISELASGTIRIDGVDVGAIGLKTLREKLSIIPQNPVLFKGTLRDYLDPFHEFSDDELWACIRQVGLSNRVSEDEKKLDMIVEENGENFSVGERQMLCMARALLRHSQIVIFDEATAAIDHETDKALQGLIRSAFASSTVLTIAHRLDTILDSDRIIVLDAGQVVEFASPAELVRKGSGHFFELMREGGYLEKFQS